MSEFGVDGRTDVLYSDDLLSLIVYPGSSQR